MTELAPGNSSHSAEAEKKGSHPESCFVVTSLTFVSDSTSLFLLLHRALLGGDGSLCPGSALGWVTLCCALLCSLRVSNALPFPPPLCALTLLQAGSCWGGRGQHCPVHQHPWAGVCFFETPGLYRLCTGHGHSAAVESRPVLNKTCWIDTKRGGQL